MSDSQPQSLLSGALCKLCGGGAAFAMERDGFTIMRCRECGFMFALIPPGYDPSALYKKDAYFGNQSKDSGIADYDGLWRRRLSHFYLPRLWRLAEFKPPPGRLLDVGCAAGYLMRGAQQLNWKAAGVELAPSMRERAARLTGARVYGSIEAALAGGELFDCVTMFEVIEHLSDPLATLRQVRELLAPGGLLALSTPNCDNPNAPRGEPVNIWFDPPDHICYFGLRTLPDCLARAGFRIVALEGLEHYCRVLAGDLSFPPWLSAILRRMRPGRRLKPGGALGKLLERAYADRLDLYQRRSPADLPRTDVLEVYASRV